MTTQQQLEANRQNAKLGGVKTDEGKAVSKYNALKHGLLSDKVLLKKEKRAELEDLRQKIRNDLKPCSEMEFLLVDRITANFWRLQRAMSLEKESVISNFGGLDMNADVFFRYEAMLERGIYKALHEFQRLKAVRTGEKSSTPIAVDVDISKN